MLISARLPLRKSGKANQWGRIVLKHNPATGVESLVSIVPANSSSREAQIILTLHDFNIPQIRQLELIDKFQIASTGISCDFLNPIFSVVNPMQCIGMPLTEQMKLVYRSVDRLPPSYEAHLHSIAVKLDLDVSTDVMQQLLEMGGERVSMLDDCLQSMRRICIDRAESLFDDQKHALIEVVEQSGCLIYGQQLWHQCGSDSVLRALDAA
jgi:hypothetical protein